MDAGEAPVFLYSNASPKDKIHPPWAAKIVYEKAQKLGVPSSLYGGDRNELPKVESGMTWLGLSVEFCQKHLNCKLVFRTSDVSMVSISTPHGRSRRGGNPPRRFRK